MAENGGGGGGGGRTAGGILQYFIPHPTLAPVKYWQGIVEIIARAVVLILLLVMFGASAAAEDETEDLTEAREYRNARAAAGWTIFIGVIAFIYQVVFIIERFLNFNYMTAFRTIILIIDIVFNSVCAVGLFAGAVSLAYYAEFTRDFIGLEGNSSALDDIIMKIADVLGASAFFSFASMFGIIFLIIWMVLFLILKWDVKGSSSTSSSAPEAS